MGWLPYDPQWQGIPARAVLLAFADLEKCFKEERIEALTVYIELIKKYDLSLLQFLRSAELLAKGLAKEWVAKYMLKCGEGDPRPEEISEYFASYENHRSHGRSIGRQQAIDIGLTITALQRGQRLDILLRSLYAQYEFLFTVSDFAKVYEEPGSLGWGHREHVIRKSEDIEAR